MQSLWEVKKFPKNRRGKMDVKGLGGTRVGRKIAK